MGSPQKERRTGALACAARTLFHHRAAWRSVGGSTRRSIRAVGPRTRALARGRWRSQACRRRGGVRGEQRESHESRARAEGVKDVVRAAFQSRAGWRCRCRWERNRYRVSPNPGGPRRLSTNSPGVAQAGTERAGTVQAAERDTPSSYLLLTACEQTCTCEAVRILS